MLLEEVEVGYEAVEVPLVTLYWGSSVVLREDGGIGEIYRVFIDVGGGGWRLIQT